MRLCFILCSIALGAALVTARLLTSDPVPSLPPPTAATPVWFGGELASGEYWATVAVWHTPIPSAVPIPTRTKRAYVANPCHTRLRGPICPTEMVPQLGAQH